MFYHCHQADVGPWACRLKKESEERAAVGRQKLDPQPIHTSESIQKIVRFSLGAKKWRTLLKSSCTAATPSQNYCHKTANPTPYTRDCTAAAISSIPLSTTTLSNNMADEENANMEEVPVEAETETEEKPVSTDGKVAEGTTVAGVTLDGTQFPLALVLISSIILLIATTASPDKWVYTKTYRNYAISISSISLIISFLSLLIHKFAGGLYAKVGEYLCVTNFTWCFIGACFLTFRGPFLTVSSLPRSFVFIHCCVDFTST